MVCSLCCFAMFCLDVDQTAELHSKFTAEIVALQTHEFRSWLAVETCFDSAGVMQRCFTGASLVVLLAVADPVFSLIFCMSQIRLMGWSGKMT